MGRVDLSHHRNSLRREALGLHDSEELLVRHGREGVLHVEVECDEGPAVDVRVFVDGLEGVCEFLCSHSCPETALRGADDVVLLRVGGEELLDTGGEELKQSVSERDGAVILWLSLVACFEQKPDLALL